MVALVYVPWRMMMVASNNGSRVRDRVVAAMGEKLSPLDSKMAGVIAASFALSRELVHKVERQIILDETSKRG